MPGEAWELSLTSERRPSRSAFAMVVTGVSHMVFRVPLCQVGPGNNIVGPRICSGSREKYDKSRAATDRSGAGHGAMGETDRRKEHRRGLMCQTYAGMGGGGWYHSSAYLYGVWRLPALCGESVFGIVPIIPDG